MTDQRRARVNDGYRVARGRPLTEGYQVRPDNGIRGFQPSVTQVKPPAPSSGSGVKPPPSQKKEKQ